MNTLSIINQLGIPLDQTSCMQLIIDVTDFYFALGSFIKDVINQGGGGLPKDGFT